MDTIMKINYVGRKEVVEGGSAGIILLSNVTLVKTLLDTDGCNENATCVIPVVLLFLSICLHIVIPVLVALLAWRENQNENIRDQLSENAGNRNDAGTETERETLRQELSDRVTARAKTNDSLNNAILGLSVVGMLLNVIINVFELR